MASGAPARSRSARWGRRSPARGGAAVSLAPRLAVAALVGSAAWFFSKQSLPFSALPRVARRQSTALTVFDPHASKDHRRCVARAAGPTAEEVGRTVIQPLYRSTPQSSAAAGDASVGQDGALQVLVLGEANICRSPLAAALLRSALAEAGIADRVHCDSRAVQDFAVGERVPPSVLEECRTQGLEVSAGHSARLWRPEWDVCDYDLLVAVDRFVAADAMKEVAVYDTIQKEVEYCGKIRGLYEFGDRKEEIEDPLYGNVGGETELLALRRALLALRASTRGLAQSLAEALGVEGAREAREAEGGSHLEDQAADPASLGELRQRLDRMLEDMGAFEWDAPPMLRKRTPPMPVEALAGDGLFSLDGDSGL